MAIFRNINNFIFPNYNMGGTVRGILFYGLQGPPLILDFISVPTKSGVFYNFNLTNFLLGYTGKALSYLRSRGLTPGLDLQKHI